MFRLYGFHPDQTINPRYQQPLPTREVTIAPTLRNLSVWAQEQGTNDHTLRVLNPWHLGHALTGKPEKLYTIRLPAVQD